MYVQSLFQTCDSRAYSVRSIPHTVEEQLAEQWKPKRAILESCWQHTLLS